MKNPYQSCIIIGDRLERHIGYAETPDKAYGIAEHYISQMHGIETSHWEIRVAARDKLVKKFIEVREE